MRNPAAKVIGGNAKVLRSINCSGILNIIREQQPISRVQIARITGLNKSTVSSVVTELLEDDLVYEELVQDANVGRNPLKLRLKLGRHFVGAINIDSARTRFAIADIDGSCLQTTSIKTEPENPDLFLKKCIQKLESLHRKSASGRLEGVGVSVAGIVDSRAEKVIVAPNLGWREVPIGKICRERLPDDTYFKVENDAKASALAELWFGKGNTHNLDDFVFLSVGVGIGAGIVIEHKLICGNFHAAGEFGHTVIIDNGKRCICGQNGCLEAYASDRATVQRFNERIKDQGNAISETKLQNIISKAQKNDADAIAILGETGRYLGFGIATIIKAIDPPAIVIGGRIVQAWNIIYPEIMQTVKERAFFGIERDIDIIPSSLTIRPRLLGAAALVFREIFNGYRIVH